MLATARAWAGRVALWMMLWMEARLQALDDDSLAAILGRLDSASTLRSLQSTCRAFLQHDAFGREWRARCEHEWPSTRLAMETRALDARELYARRARAHLSGSCCAKPAFVHVRSTMTPPSTGPLTQVPRTRLPGCPFALVDVHVSGIPVAYAQLPGSCGTVRAFPCASSAREDECGWFELGLTHESGLPTLAEAMTEEWELSQQLPADPAQPQAGAFLQLVEQQRAWAAVHSFSGGLRVTCDALLLLPNPSWGADGNAAGCASSCLPTFRMARLAALELSPGTSLDDTGAHADDGTGSQCLVRVSQPHPELAAVMAEGVSAQCEHIVLSLTRFPAQLRAMGARGLPADVHGHHTPDGQDLLPTLRVCIAMRRDDLANADRTSVRATVPWVQLHYATLDERTCICGPIHGGITAEPPDAVRAQGGHQRVTAPAAGDHGVDFEGREAIISEALAVYCRWSWT